MRYQALLCILLARCKEAQLCKTSRNCDCSDSIFGQGLWTCEFSSLHDNFIFCHDYRPSSHVLGLKLWHPMHGYSKRKFVCLILNMFISPTCIYMLVAYVAPIRQSGKQAFSLCRLLHT